MNIQKSDWYELLIEDCMGIVTEGVHKSRWTLIETYHGFGQRILADFHNFERSKIYGEKIVPLLAESFKQLRQQEKNKYNPVSERVIWRAIQFAKKFPDLQKAPFTKNDSWNKIVTKYLPDKPKPEPIKCTCPKCGNVHTKK